MQVWETLKYERWSYIMPIVDTYAVTGCGQGEKFHTVYIHFLLIIHSQNIFTAKAYGILLSCII